MSLPIAAMERLLKKVGVERVSEEAKSTLKELLEDHAENIGKKAWEIAKHSKRKTLKSGDLKIASK
ncbi:MAG: histone [Nanoarchaeota archaeon]|nr:histone [Nanoarchaeota archaeon]|tara:strand:- start:223 stop:420 length:198 start_codon:yes stop_codon:yes gene_type:complete